MGKTSGVKGYAAIGSSCIGGKGATFGSRNYDANKKHIVSNSRVGLSIRRQDIVTIKE